MKRSALPPRRTPIRKVSTKRAALLRVYSKKRKAFLAAHPLCEVWLGNNGFHWAGPETYGHSVPRPLQTTAKALASCGAPLATDIHHKAGRIGEKLNDESLWMAVSREAHSWIHQNPKEARARGWLI